MNIKVGIGFSQEEDLRDAAESAAEQARQQLGEDRIDIAFLLTTQHYSPQQVLPIVEQTLNHTRIIGGTTAGIILADGLKRRGIAVMALNSDTTKFQSVHASHLNLKDLTDAGQSFVKEHGQHFGQKERKLLLFFYDGLLENMSLFLHGIEKELGEYFPTMAVGNSDHLLFSETIQYHDNTVSSFGACGVIWGGEANIHMSRAHGWKPLGKPRLVKKAKKNIIEKIGNLPAIQLYEEFFKDNLGALKNDIFGKLNARYPLGLFTKPKEEYIIRNIMDVLEDGSLVCQDEVKEGSEIHIMLGDKTSCLQSASEAAHQLRKRIKKDSIQCLLIFESAMRWQILKHSWKEELQVIKNVLGDGFPIFGMLTYSESFNSGMLTEAEKNSILSGNIMLMAVV